MISCSKTKDVLNRLGFCGLLQQIVRQTILIHHVSFVALSGCTLFQQAFQRLFQLQHAVLDLGAARGFSPEPGQEASLLWDLVGCYQFPQNNSTASGVNTQRRDNGKQGGRFNPGNDLFFEDCNRSRQPARPTCRS